MTARQTIKVALDDFSPGEFDGTLADLRNKINEMIDDYGPTARLDYDRDHWYQYDDSPSPRYFLTTYREETDEEMAEQEEKTKAIEKAREERELAELERLQKKYKKKGS